MLQGSTAGGVIGVDDVRVGYLSVGERSGKYRGSMGFSLFLFDCLTTLEIHTLKYDNAPNQ